MAAMHERTFRILVSACIIACLAGCAAPPTASPTASPPPATARPTSSVPPTVRSTSLPPTSSGVPSTMVPVNPATGSPSTSIPGPSATPIATPGLIISFTADQQDADPGDEITLRWQVILSADRMTLCRMMPTGQYGTCWDVVHAGSQQVTIPAEWRNTITYTLGVAAGDDTEIATVTLRLSCPDTWFMADPPGDCPAFPPQASSGSAQYFENGFMIWRSDSRTIYVFYYDVMGSPGVQVVSDQWAEGMPESDPSLVPPAGLYQPVRGFGRVWRGEAGYSGVRERIGWALGGEFAFDTIFQCDSAPRYNICYLQGPDGVILIRPNNSGWEIYQG